MAAHSGEANKYVFVYDRREKEAPEIKIDTRDIKTFAQFKACLHEVVDLKKSEKYVIATTNREEIKDDETWDIVDNAETLYLLQTLEQELCAPAQERVNYLPHYDTIVKGGMYEYYASEGQNPLPYAFAELIDNSLAATRNNAGPRQIEIRLLFDESTIYVIDNGKGMTSRQLNNWAIYRLSKFIRKDKRSKVSLDETVEEEQSFVDHTLPKSLNSDISYFGVGGKQAIFFIGTSTRMITKTVDSQDVHELTISKEEFEMKELNHEDIYSGYIRNRKVGDTSHVPEEEESLRRIISEEKHQEHFTVVVIQGISKTHLTYLKEKIKEWTRQLAHIYHYYLHGPMGNLSEQEKVVETTPSPFQNISIEVKLIHKAPQEIRTIHLRDIENDMQTLFVRGSASSFEFKALIDGAKVEGVLRYHPFLYDRETFPFDIYDKFEHTIEDEHDYAVSEQPARGRKPIFDCFWNGRLIPYTQIDSFEWCNPPKKVKNIPGECYNRVSGVLWTDDNFQVSTNKLTFIDLELKLRDKITVFTRILNGQEKRTSIEKEFTSWLRDCHELYDKQIFFSQFLGNIVRLDLPKQRQSPWAAYKQVDWDGKVYKSGQLVKILRTVPVLLGSISRILLYGDYTEDVFATGGDLEIIQEPRSLYSEVKIVPLSKLDRTASQTQVRRCIEDEEAKLPDELHVTWPEGNQVLHNEKRKAGKTIGDIRIEILNKKGDAISKLPGKDNVNKKLLVELKVIWHSSMSDQIIVSHISQHGKTWPYWFRKMENINNLGSYTLQLQTVLNESAENMFAGKVLPYKKISFQVIEGEAERFSVGLLEGPFRVGVPFSIPLDLQDSHGNPSKSAGLNLKPKIEASGLDLQYGNTSVKGHSFTIKDVIAKGPVVGNTGKNYSLTITVPEFNNYSQNMKIRLLPGPASKLSVTPEEDITMVNGSAPNFKVQVQDVSGNPSALEGRQSFICKFSGANSLPTYFLESSVTGGFLTGPPILLKKMKAEISLTAKFDVQGSKVIKTVERRLKLVPSGKTSDIQLFYRDSESGKTLQIKNKDEIQKTAGDMLEGVTFRLFDEAEQELKLTDKLVNKIKINWTTKPSKDLLLKGQLPSVKAANSVLEGKYCQVSIVESSDIELGFVIKTLPGEPNVMKCTLSGSNQLSIGHPLDSHIHVKIADKFGNEIPFDSSRTCQDLKITGDGIKVNRFSKVYDKNLKSIVVKGIVFEGGTMGKKELQITWNNLKDYVRLEMVAGPPSQMKVLHYEQDEDITVFNESAFPKPLAIQLLDEGGNTSRVADIRVQLAKDVKLKLIPTVQPTKTNKEGIADFGTFTVSCAKGTYEVQPKAYISTGYILSGPKIKVVVQPDPNRPSSLLVVYNVKSGLTAGNHLPDYTVKVNAEDGCLLTCAKASHLSLKLWKSDGQESNNLPSRTLSYSPDVTKKYEAGVFHFKSIDAPEEAGTYNIMFVYYDGKHQVFSNVIHSKVEPSAPVQLVSLDEPGTATVSNTKNYASRSIVRNLRLELKDKYNNHVTRGMNGKINVDVTNVSGNNEELPLLAFGSSKMKHLFFTLAGGSCFVSNISIQENSPGKDGCQYQLELSVACDQIDPPQPMLLPFLFYNDAKKQSEMATLSKERDTLQNAIRTYKSLFETTEQLIEELKISVKEAKMEENRIRDELRKKKVVVANLQSAESIDKMIKECTSTRQHITDEGRRMCSLPIINAGDQEVLGKIGHLALISDNDAARVLSWHMSSDMDCIVTMNTDKAKEIYQQTNGRQQVLPLDSIFKKTLTEWNKPLPHVKYKPNWRPSGNLMYARNLIAFPKNEDKCKIVFSMLLGDTLWIDRLDQANDYRRELVKYTNCPTILTREGDRIRSNGKFGGLMNKAPPVEKLRGAIFGAPMPDKYNHICSTIDTLHSLKSALVAHKTAKEELDDQMATIKAPEMQAKYDECAEVEKQLANMERRLGVATSKTHKSHSSPMVTAVIMPKIEKRQAYGTNDDETTAPKRLRGTPATSEVNGTTSTTPNISLVQTPTRTSRRIAAMSPTEPERKRSKTSSS